MYITECRWVFLTYKAFAVISASHETLKKWSSEQKMITQGEKLTKAKWIFRIISTTSTLLLSLLLFLQFRYSLCFAQCFRCLTGFSFGKRENENGVLHECSSGDHSLLFVKYWFECLIFQPGFEFRSNILLCSVADKPEKMLRHIRVSTNVNF